MSENESMAAVKIPAIKLAHSAVEIDDLADEMRDLRREMHRLRATTSTLDRQLTIVRRLAAALFVVLVALDVALLVR